MGSWITDGEETPDRVLEGSSLLVARSLGIGVAGAAQPRLGENAKHPFNSAKGLASPP